MAVRSLSFVLALSLSIPAVPLFAAEPAEVLVARDRERDRSPVVQVALLLDTSNSMDGLIDQARTQLWTIVNEFARCKRDGRSPRLQVALYEYGNDGLPTSNGHVRLVQPFTSDLDLVSEKLWGLKTNGGSEYCGTVIRAATKELVWDDQRDAYRAIFIAGNEPFTQGDVDYKMACGIAIARSIVVNTIHCGPDDAGRSGQWADGARLGEGKYMTIDKDRVIRGIIAPQDEKIQKLSAELNTTYIPLGLVGRENAARQLAQDEVVASAPSAVAAGAAVQRSVAKAQVQYDNSSWDLVDAAREGKLKVAEVKDDQLPEELKKLSTEERTKYVETQAAKRADIQKQINDLNAERGKYIAEKQKEQAGDAETLDSAVVKVVREQLKERQFEVAN